VIFSIPENRTLKGPRFASTDEITNNKLKTFPKKKRVQEAFRALGKVPVLVSNE
jgi:hypothetical protein